MIVGIYQRDQCAPSFRIAWEAESRGGGDRITDFERNSASSTEMWRLLSVIPRFLRKQRAIRSHPRDAARVLESRVPNERQIIERKSDWRSFRTQ